MNIVLEQLWIDYQNTKEFKEEIRKALDMGLIDETIKVIWADGILLGFDIASNEIKEKIKEEIKESNE